MTHLSIKSKLLVMLLAVSLFSIGVVASLNYYTSYRTLQAEVFSHLTSVRASRADQIEQFVDRLRSETRVVGSSSVIVAAAQEFMVTFRQLESLPVDPDSDLVLRNYYEGTFLPELDSATGHMPEVDTLIPESSASRYLQAHYLARNPYPIAEKSELLGADDGSAYSQSHAKYHHLIKRFLHELGFADAYIVDIDTATIVYSETKQPDFATRLTDGPYAHSHLAELFRTLQRSPDRGLVGIADFQPYAPALGAPSAFIGTPILHNGRAIAVLILRVSDNAINRVMTGGNAWERDGLGKTGETYLVGPDFRMRSNSRFMIEDPVRYTQELREQRMSEAEIKSILRHKSTILTQKVHSYASEQAIAGNEGTGVSVGYRGVEALSSWAPLRIAGLDWGIVSKIDRSEAYAPMQRMARDTLIQTLVVLLVITLAVMFLATSFVRPVNDLIARVRQARAGQTDVSFATESTDEIGDLASSFRELIGSVQKQTRLLGEVTHQNHQLLENLMPKGMAQRVRIGQAEITERIEDVTVVFAELRGLAEYTHTTSDNESVAVLKRLISAFDEVAAQHSVERIKVIGDMYLAVVGLSQPLLDHVSRAVAFAVAARAIVADFNHEKNAQLGLTVGIDCGSVVADVMGQGQFLFQIWGTPVIAADHAMDNGEVNDIVVTRNVRDRLTDQYTFESLQTSKAGAPLWTLADRV